MLSFLHLSDLHINTVDADTQFDRDVKIRAALVADLGKEGREKFDGIFVTGDIAFSGRAKEFSRAKTWLEELRVLTKCSPEAIFVVPGNHDVNQRIVPEGSSLWELHQILRQPHLNLEERTSSLSKKLHDPTLDFLAGMSEYSAFAGEYGCQTSAQKLAWVQTLADGMKLEDGTVVRLHGLNTALISDDKDTTGKLFLSEFQFQHFNADPGYVNIAMCHHPPSYLIDEAKARDYFNNQTQLLLCGHEHQIRHEFTEKCLRIFAGAVHPNRREMNWKPCYNIIRIQVRKTTKRELVVQLETREWNDEGKCFGPHQEASGGTTHEQIIELPNWSPIVPIQSDVAEAALAPPPSREGTMAATLNAEEFSAARRKLIVHFYRLGHLKRVEAAVAVGVWEEGDEDLPAQSRWAKMFDRAEKKEKLKELWGAIAEQDGTLVGQSNPFESNS